MSATKNFPVVVYDLHDVSRFFRSVAMALALQRHTSTEWVEYRDSTALNAVYTVLFWKEPPGTMEVKMAKHAVIEKTVDELHERFLLGWIKKLFEGGPSAAVAYANDMARLREYARKAVQELIAGAQEVNDEIIGITNEGIKRLAYIRLGAAVGVAVIGGAVGVAYAGAAMGGAAATGAAATGGAATGAAAGTAGGISILGIPAGATAGQFAAAGLGISVTNTVIKTWEDSTKAKVVGISTDAGKAALSEGGGKLTGRLLEDALEKQTRSGQIMRSAEGQIRKYSQRLGQEGLKKAARRKAHNIVNASRKQFAREADNLAQAGKMAKIAGNLGRGIPVVFAAWDIIDAFSDFQDTMKTVR